jgi:hypothetical protein
LIRLQLPFPPPNDVNVILVDEEQDLACVPHFLTFYSNMTTQYFRVQASDKIADNIVALDIDTFVRGTDAELYTITPFYVVPILSETKYEESDKAARTVKALNITCD